MFQRAAKQTSQLASWGGVFLLDLGRRRCCWGIDWGKNLESEYSLACIFRIFRSGVTLTQYCLSSVCRRHLLTAEMRNQFTDTPADAPPILQNYIWEPPPHLQLLLMVLAGAAAAAAAATAATAKAATSDIFRQYLWETWDNSAKEGLSWWLCVACYRV